MSVSNSGSGGEQNRSEKPAALTGSLAVGGSSDSSNIVAGRSEGGSTGGRLGSALGGGAGRDGGGRGLGGGPAAGRAGGPLGRAGGPGLLGEL